MNAVPIGTQSFQCFTAAGPARVWAALTGAQETSRYLHGLGAHSSWQADAAILFRTNQSPTATDSSLIGRVLHVTPLCQLSYSVQSGPEDPPVYLTWQIRPCQGGSAIRLQIDEMEYADSDEEAENTWLPILASLQALLASEEAARPEGYALE
jgi:uncharacterized protein YndB with AHSA1/START domain